MQHSALDPGLRRGDEDVCTKPMPFRRRAESSPPVATCVPAVAGMTEAFAETADTKTIVVLNLIQDP